jgi:hypothetical protein
MLGLLGMIITLVIVSFMRDFIAVFLSLRLAGFFWAFVNVNSIVMLWEVSRKKQGAYTGIY